MFVRKKFPQSLPVEAHQIGQESFPDVSDILQGKQTLTVYESIDGKISSHTAKADLAETGLRGYWLVIERIPTFKKMWLINDAGFNQIFAPWSPSVEPTTEEVPDTIIPESVPESVPESEILEIPPEEIQVKKPRARRTKTVDSSEISE